MKEYIERGKVQEMLENAHIISDDYDEYCGYCTEDVDISSIPAADVVERKRGDGCVYCRGTSYADKPFKVVTQMGREVEVVFNFCPSCGADMRKTEANHAD